MSVIDDIREMLGQFRAGVTELAEADRKQVAELQRLRITTARQADEIDEQRGIIARLTSQNRAHDANHLRSADAMGETVETVEMLRAQLAACAQLAETQCGHLDRLTAELEKERGRHLDITELRAMLERRYKEQPEEMGDLLDALYTAIERTLPARPGQLTVVAQLGAERQKRYEVELELARVREELEVERHITEKAMISELATLKGETLPSLTAHVRTLLGILDAIGGYMPSDYQDAIRAAREAVQK